MKSLNKAASDLLIDPLSTVARGARRGILLFSSACLIVSFTGLSSSEVGLLGIKLSNVSELHLYLGLLVVLIFSLITFLLHGHSDLERYRHTLNEYHEQISIDVYHKMHGSFADETYDYNEAEFREMTGYKPYNLNVEKVKRLSACKYFLDFLFPLIYGVLAGLVILIRIIWI